MNKKGLSEVVTTVLIILLVLAAIIIVWAVVKPMLDRSAQQINIDSLTSSLSIVPNSATVTSDGNITLKVKRNADPGNISGVNVVLETASGQRKTFKIPGAINELETKTITISAIQHGITEQITNALISAIVTGSNGQEITSSIISSSSKVNPPAPAVCGDGALQYGEPCDGTNLNGQTCQTLGYLTGTLNCSSCSFNTSQCFDLNNGLVSYYKFEEAVYSGIAGEVKDQTGRNNGTTLNGPTTNTGKVNRSIFFDGTDDYISIPGINVNSFNFSKDFTITLWMKPFSLGTSRVITGFNNPSDWWHAGDNILILNSDGSLQVQINGYGLFSTGAKLNPSNWGYVSWTFSGSNRKSVLYVNGIKDSEYTFVNSFPQNADSIFRIGRYGNGWYLKGLLDEFMLFNRTLSDSDINLLYSSYS